MSGKSIKGAKNAMGAKGANVFWRRWRSARCGRAPANISSPALTHPGLTGVEREPRRASQSWQI